MPKSHRHWVDTPPDHAGLKHASVRSGVINVLAQGIKFILNFAVLAILAHLLVPADFGLVAMAMVVVNFFLVFKNAGLSVATIQKEHLTHEQVSMMFWLSSAIGLLLGVALLISAPFVAAVYGDERLTGVMVWMAVMFVAGGLGVQHEALMRRQLRYRGLALLEILSLLAGSTIAIVAAKCGAGYMALVWMQLCVVAVRTIGVWVLCRWLPSLPVRRIGAKKMALFGGHVTGFNVLHYITVNADQMLLGIKQGAVQLGYYSTAMQLVLMPVSQINQPIGSVAMVTLSRLQSDPERFRSAFLRLSMCVAYASFPLIALLGLFAEEFVAIVLGDQWHEAALIIEVLAVATWTLPLANTMGWLLTSLGQTARMLKWGLIATPVMVAAFVIGIEWGLIGLVTAYTVATLLLRWPHFSYCFSHSPVDMKGYLSVLWRPLVWTLAMLTAAAAVKLLLGDANPWMLLLSGVVVAVICGVLLALLWTGIRQDMASMISLFRRADRNDLEGAV